MTFEFLFKLIMLTLTFAYDKKQVCTSDGDESKLNFSVRAYTGYSSFKLSY